MGKEFYIVCENRLLIYFRIKFCYGKDCNEIYDWNKNIPFLNKITYARSQFDNCRLYYLR